MRGGKARGGLFALAWDLEDLAEGAGGEDFFCFLECFERDALGPED